MGFMAGTFLPKFRLAFETHFQSLPRCKEHRSLEEIWPQACQIINERKASRTRELEIRRIATAMAVGYAMKMFASRKPVLHRYLDYTIGTDMRNRNPTGFHR